MEKYLTLPLEERDVRSLKLGDIVYLSGEIVQLLSAAHKRAIEMNKKGEPLPFELENRAIYHCYTSLKEENDSLQCNFLGASTSAGVNYYEPEFIRTFRIRAVIGKGGMNLETLEAMKEVGCVYLAQIGGCCQLSTQAVSSVNGKFWEDLAANFGVQFTFNNLGPLIVGMDANGNSLYHQIQDKVEKNAKKVLENII
jgi:fumarate hydratase subunit beta